MATPANLIKNAPVTALSTAESVTAFALTVLVTHHVIGNVDIGATAQTIAPFIALAIPAVFGAAKWALVSPYAKVKGLAEQQGVVTDADFARMEALVEDKLGGLISDPEPVPAADEPNLRGYADAPEFPNGGMAAGQVVKSRPVSLDGIGAGYR